MSKVLTVIGSATILFLMPLACSTLLADGVEAPKLALLELGTALLMAAAFWQIWNRRGWPWASHPLLHTGLAFFLWSIVCSLINGAHTYSLPAMLCAFSCAALTAIWSAYLRRDQLWWGAGLISLVVFTTGLYAHLQRLTLADLHLGSIRLGDFMDWQPIHLAWERTIATMGNPNYFATYLVGALPLTLVWALTRKKPFQRGIAVLLWISSAVAMILTQTRSAWLAGAAITPLFVWLVWRSTPASERKRRLMVIGATLLTTLVATQIVFAWQKQLKPQLDLNYRLANFANQSDMSIQARYYFWHTALNSALLHPVFGCGAGGHEVRAMQDRDIEPLPLRFPVRQMENVHCQPLQTLAESGWLGLALLLASFWLYAKTLGGRRDLLSAGLLSSAVALWLSQLFICANTPCWSLWAFYLAAAVIIGRESDNVSDISASDMSVTPDTPSSDITSNELEKQDNCPESSPLPRRIMGITVIVVILTAMSISAFINVKCEYDINRGLLAHEDANIALGRDKNYEQARNLYLSSEQFYMQALREAPVWRQALVYRSLGNLVRDMYTNLSQNSDEALYESSKECYESALLYNECEPFTYSCLADLQRRTTLHMPQALDSIEGALAIDPLNPQYNNQKALILLYLRRYSDSRAVAQHALEHCPISPQLWHTLATIHRCTGEYDLAEKDLQNLLKLDPRATQEAEAIRKIERH